MQLSIPLQIGSFISFVVSRNSNTNQFYTAFRFSSIYQYTLSDAVNMIEYSSIVVSGQINDMHAEVHFYIWIPL